MFPIVSVRRLAEGIVNRARPPLYGAVNALSRRQHVAMFHIGRCGSQVLGEMLDQHPAIFWDGEIFQPYMQPQAHRPPDFVQRTIAGSRHKRISAIYGFETKYLPQFHLSEACINMSLEGYVDLLRELRFTKFIVLHRANYLRRSVSVGVLSKTRTPHVRHEVRSATKISVDIDGARRRQSLLELFRSLDHQHRRLISLLSPDEKLCLNYEDDIRDDPGHAYRKVCEFLGVEEARPQIKLKRTNSFEYGEVIDNFDAVRTTLQGTEYAWMLDD
jgi:hypothetical protein